MVSLERAAVERPYEDTPRFMLIDEIRECVGVQPRASDAPLYSAWADLIERQLAYAVIDCPECNRQLREFVVADGGVRPAPDCRCGVRQGVDDAHRMLNERHPWASGQSIKLRDWLIHRTFPAFQFDLGIVMWRRGFVDTIALDHATFVTYGPMLAALNPVCRWVLVDIAPKLNRRQYYARGDGDTEEEMRLGFGWGAWDRATKGAFRYAASLGVGPARQTVAPPRPGAFKVRKHRDEGNILHPQLYQYVRRFPCSGGRVSVSHELRATKPAAGDEAQALEWLRWGCGFYARVFSNARLPEIDPVELDAR